MSFILVCYAACLRFRKRFVLRKKIANSKNIYIYHEIRLEDLAIWCIITKNCINFLHSLQTHAHFKFYYRKGGEILVHVICLQPGLQGSSSDHDLTEAVYLSCNASLFCQSWGFQGPVLTAPHKTGKVAPKCRDLPDIDSGSVPISSELTTQTAL